MDDHRTHTLMVLARLARRRPSERAKLAAAIEGRLGDLLETAVSVATETGGPIGEVVAEAFASARDPSLIQRAARALPLDTIALRPLALEVHERGRDVPAPPPGDEQGWLDRIGRLNLLSHAQRRAGSSDRAAATAREGVALARGLEGEFPGRYAAAIASALNMLAASLPLDEAGAKESVPLLQEAVRITRELAADDPGRFEDQLADNLNDLAWSARAAGDITAAVEAAREAVERIERLTGPEEETERNLASALYTLGSMSLEAGDPDGACVAAGRAVALHEARVARRPDDALVDLVECRILQADALTACGRAEAFSGTFLLVVEDLRLLLEHASDPLPDDVRVAIRGVERLAGQFEIGTEAPGEPGADDAMGPDPA